MEVFQDYAYYYNMIYKEKNYAEEAKIVDRLIKKKVDKKNELSIDFYQKTLTVYISVVYI